MQPPVDKGSFLLKLTFVFLVLVLVGELFYAFVFSNKKLATFVTPTPIINKLVPTTVITNNPPTSSSASEKLNLTPTPIQEYQGKIIELNIIKVTPTPGAYNIEFSFKIEVNEGEVKKPFIFAFDKNALIGIKVTDSTGKTISYKDLKVGQNIRLNNDLGKIDILN